MLSSKCFAEWTYVGENKKNTYYVDLKNIKVKNNNLFFWSLLDYKNINQFGDLSVKMMTEIDCNLMRTKDLYGIWYASNMGKGKINAQGDKSNTKWRYNPPGSAAYMQSEIVCNFVNK